MKRLVLLAGALVVSTAAQAADDTEVKHNGEFRVRYFNDMVPSGVKDEPKNTSDIEGRMKLGFTLRKGETMQAHLGVLHGTYFGTDKAASTSLTGAGYNTHTKDNGLLVNQAYAWWKAGDGYSLKAGRFNVEIGGGEFFATNNWLMVPTTHEGFKLGMDTDFANFDVYMIKDKELTPKNPGTFDSDPEQHNWIVSADLKNMPEAVKTANLTFVNFNRSEIAGTGAANAQHIGVTVGGDVSSLMYKLVAAFQSGVASKTATAEQKFAGSMFDVTLGYGMPETMGLKVWANYHMDSGDDSATDDKTETYQSLYYDSRRYGGSMDLFPWGNLTYWNIGATLAPADDLEVGLGLYGYTKTKENGSYTAGARPNGTAVSAIAATGKADLGMELDVWAAKKYGSSFGIDAHFGAFMPGAAFKDATIKKEATIMQLMVAGTMMF